MAFLKNQETEEIFYLDKPSVLFSNKPHTNLSKSQYKIFENISFQTKHAIIQRKTSDQRHQLVDLCSEETLLLRKNGSEISLKAMQFYDLEDGDTFFIGGQQLVYNQIEKSEVIGPSQIEMISNNQPRVMLKRVHFIVPGTEETDEELEESSEKLEDIEFPETPEGNHNLENSDDNSNEELQMETQSYLEQFDNLDDVPARDENLDLMTQPFFNLPPATRLRTKQQNSLKPNTRSLDEFESTQANTGNFYMETQPFELAPSSLLKSLIGCKIPPKKVNKILLSSTDSESSDESGDEVTKGQTYASEGTTDEVLFKMSMSQSPPKNPPKVENIMKTPGMLPKIPSQILMDTDLLEKVNSSQSVNDDAILDLKQEGESDDMMNVPLHETSSYKRPGTQLQLKPKKKVKFMKYASDEEN